MSSALDPPCPEHPPRSGTTNTITGSTTWAAGAPLTRAEISWRWALLQETIVIIEPQRIRTNLELIDGAGGIEPPRRALIHVLERLERIPWQTAVREYVIRRRH